VLGGANVTTQLLKPALGAALDPGAAPAGFVAAWPSGHTTAAMSLALSLVLVAPARWRPAAGAAAGLGVVAIVSSIVTTGAHLPSDILGGFGVATAWAWLGVAVLLAAGRSPEPRPGLLPALAPPLLAGLAAAGVTLAAVMMRPDAAVAYAQEHTTFVVGAVAIGAAALSLLAGLAFALRR
jgi:membrane-associated phospholipid phosphatase